MYNGKVLFGPVPAIVVVGNGMEKEIGGNKYFSFLQEIPDGDFVEVLVLGEIASLKISALVEIKTRMEGDREIAFVFARVVNLGANPIFKLQIGPLGQEVNYQMPRVELGEAQIGFV
ncbi:MAG: hypothetical protein Q8L11_05105 [Candidatus Moranbacteria bacterium]|nr:hypothetical protein [bacterium]MDP1834275.1 hypothetical protein [Candidatus Moranbacteria bacterium]